ncbi:DUF6527 family protein [Mesorhizobium sp. M6A.T.Ce.TU.016.01.1.1]|uniref:DUF6527 family protein n=1 Tax=Mesorhizobium sp. M6A.T.Ce.TU.016.01.1.1 TaxID=2496783 RepID=UPI000FC9B1BF|nr:DUF6527 family protein [Mesorhizobium sp. M6A.T.Ce.TU.016.01.1.1]RUU29779.1 hypothetical protein EOC94_13000 [Mesorhizobium sp. M6A.T.Ce.TU.016.01.1.1]
MMLDVSVCVQPRAEDRAFIVVSCPLNGECKWSVWKREPVGAMWTWDGNVEVPTIRPSIDCRQAGCGRHFSIEGGKAVSHL